ncbi:hypothetical protein J5N97_024984 [Dioscorea zingiberensis]|uniref:RRM domain-containing protein n=1 Tax=Dioscorea zingiberensis TaxID=325984 RepID=A0A9D5C909_9LILI|nr:hypothetical protein J5N97_024984 [Dioscorea zingiberensis]
MSVRTVRVSNVSLSASEKDVKEFFSFSGDIEYIEMESADEWSQIAYVTFKDSQGADTALLLSGATIVDLSVIITTAPDYQIPPHAALIPTMDAEKGSTTSSESAVQKAEDVVSSMLAKGFVLGKDALSKAKTFNEKLKITSTAASTVSSFDKKIGLGEKITSGTSAVNEKVKEMDQRFQVSEKIKSAFAAAEQTASSEGSAILKSRYVFTGASLVTGAFNKVAKAATDVGSKTKEKVAAVQHQKKEGTGE